MDGPETFKGESAEVRNPVQKVQKGWRAKKASLEVGNSWMRQRITFCLSATSSSKIKFYLLKCLKNELFNFCKKKKAVYLSGSLLEHAKKY